MSIQVLLCDDHCLARYMASEVLAGTSDIAVVGEAQNGEAAVQMARRLAPDVVVMDVEMAGINAIEATRRIVEEVPGVQVLAWSAEADWQQVLAMITAGASGYLLNLWSVDALPSAIRAVAAGETYLSGAIAGVAVSSPLDASFRRLFSFHFRFGCDTTGQNTACRAASTN